MKDVCRLTGFNSSTIRYYDSQNLLGQVERQANNYRVFDEKDIEKLLFIKKARSLGFELEEIRKILVLKNSGIHPCNYVSQKIEEKISFIKVELIRLEKEKVKLENHLSDARNITGCRGDICHYIEGRETQGTLRKLDEVEALNT